ATALVDPVKPVKRAVVHDFADYNVGKNRCIGRASLDDLVRPRRGCHPVLALTAGIFVAVVFVLDEVPRYILERPRNILADPPLGHAALRAHPLRFRYLVVVNLALDCSGPDAAMAFPWTFLLSPGLLGLRDLPIQFGVLSCLGLGIDRRCRVSLVRLAAQHLE